MFIEGKMIHLQIDCDPVPWSAATKGKHGFYDKKSKEKEFARWQLKSQYRDVPIPGYVSIEFIFNIPIPKSASKALRREMLNHRVLPTTPDTTNMQKLYEDCLQGIVIDNDRLCNKITSIRYYSEKPGVLITVRSWNEELNRGHEIPQHQWVKV
jgi:Holliday junction resolvase RusA-like endonuclease